MMVWKRFSCVCTIYLTSVIVLLIRKSCTVQNVFICKSKIITDRSANATTNYHRTLEFNNQIIKAHNAHQSNFVFAPRRKITVKASNDIHSRSFTLTSSKLTLFFSSVPSLRRGNCVDTTSVLIPRTPWLMVKKQCLFSV